MTFSPCCRHIRWCNKTFASSSLAGSRLEMVPVNWTSCQATFDLQGERELRRQKIAIWLISRPRSLEAIRVDLTPAERGLDPAQIAEVVLLKPSARLN